jgi:hypothetical protein
MGRKPISIPEEPGKRDHRVTPDLVRAERAAVLVILFHLVCLLLLVGPIVLVLVAGRQWFPVFFGVYALGFIGFPIAGLIYLSRKR